MNNQTADHCEGSGPGPGGASVAGSPVALVQGTALPLTMGRALPLVQGTAVPHRAHSYGAKDRSLIDEFYSPNRATTTTQRGRS